MCDTKPHAQALACKFPLGHPGNLTVTIEPETLRQEGRRALFSLWKR